MIALTTLTHAQEWLGITTSDDDALLKRLIQQISTATLAFLERPTLLRTTFAELRNGVGNRRLTLRNWPVVGVNLLQVNGATIPAAASAASPGYTLIPWDGSVAGNLQEITLNSYCFIRGLANISINYTAGYCLQKVAYTVPTGGSMTVNTDLGPWAQDDGVSYAGTGAVLTPVKNSPAQGQYTVVADALGGAIYTFNVADISSSLLVSFSYTPFDVEQAVIEWIGERYRYRDRIGQTSKSLGGSETGAYSLKMPEFISQTLEPYRKRVPI